MRWRSGQTLVALLSVWALMGTRGISSEPTAAPREALERTFVSTMTGAVLVGSFTITGQAVDATPRPDKYTITKVEKKDGNNWLIVAKVEYEKGSYPVAVKVPVEWAGTTPVICVMDLEIPLIGKGKFGARVLFDGDKYAGTWSHDAVGGHMFGKIERQTADANKTGTKE